MIVWGITNIIDLKEACSMIEWGFKNIMDIRKASWMIEWGFNNIIDFGGDIKANRNGQYKINVKHNWHKFSDRSTLQNYLKHKKRQLNECSLLDRGIKIMDLNN